MSDIFGSSHGSLHFGIYRALVISTEDSLFAGRIKVRVYPMFHGVTDDQLPWCVPASPLFCGAGEGTGSFCVPDVGSYVFVFFEAGRITEPVYIAEAPTATKGLPDERIVNYPDRRVVKSKSGISVIIDDVEPKMIVNIPAGSKLVVNADTGAEICLGDELGDRLVRFSDIGAAPGGNLSSTSGGPCFFINPLSGTQKVKGS